MDAVQAAESGHPGTPMALAPLAYVLYTRHLRHDPAAPQWMDRDRFVLSPSAAAEWDKINRRSPKELAGLRRLMQRRSPFTE